MLVGVRRVAVHAREHDVRGRRVRPSHEVHREAEHAGAVRDRHDEAIPPPARARAVAARAAASVLQLGPWSLHARRHAQRERALPEPVEKSRDAGGNGRVVGAGAGVGGDGPLGFVDVHCWGVR